MLLSLNPIDARLFTVDACCKLLIAEHSDLNNVRFVRLYDDACDEGLVLINPKSHAMTHWYVSYEDEQRDREGDLQVTVLKPVSETLRKMPHLEGWRIHLFND